MNDITKDKERLNNDTNRGFSHPLAEGGLAFSTCETNGYTIVRVERAEGHDVAHCVVTEAGDILFAIKFLLGYADLCDTTLYDAIAADTIKGLAPYAFCSLYPGYRRVDTLYVTGKAVCGIVDRAVRDTVISEESVYRKRAENYAAFVSEQLAGDKAVAACIVNLASKRVKASKGNVPVKSTMKGGCKSAKAKDGSFGIAIVGKYKASDGYRRVYALQGPDANVSFMLSPNGTMLFRLSEIMFGPSWASCICSGLWSNIVKSKNADRNSAYRGCDSGDDANRRVKYASAPLIMEGLRAYKPRGEMSKTLIPRAKKIVAWLEATASRRSDIDAVFDKLGLEPGNRMVCSPDAVRRKERETPSKAAFADLVGQTGSLQPMKMYVEKLDKELAVEKTKGMPATKASAATKKASTTEEPSLDDLVQAKLTRIREDSQRELNDTKRELELLKHRYEERKAELTAKYEAIKTKLDQCNSASVLSGVLLVGLKATDTEDGNDKGNKA